ncbi:MAG: ATP synthase F1 subunit delta, partial [Actinomycetota bacterium]|nr:ATP synthase F1 subunit delta [Actinomycetota bacterium]
MINVSSAAARVYAQALFDIGCQEHAVGSIYDDLHAVHDAIGGLDAELQTFFKMPQLRREDKRRIFKAAFEDKVGRPVLGLLLLLVEKRREPLFDNVVAEFDRYRDRLEGRVRASVTTARKLDADLAQALRAALEQRTQKTVVLHERVDPEVLGGIRVNLGDSVLDGTIRRGLQDMR